MDTVRIEDFPSSTNFKNFEYDLRQQLPDLLWRQDDGNEAIVMALEDYESNRDQITELVGQAGAVAFHPTVTS